MVLLKFTLSNEVLLLVFSQGLFETVNNGPHFLSGLQSNVWVWWLRVSERRYVDEELDSTWKTIPVTTHTKTVLQLQLALCQFLHTFTTAALMAP